jgi:hypothetical protein
LSRQYEILNISQPYRPPRPVTGIALLFFTDVRLDVLITVIMRNSVFWYMAPFSPLKGKKINLCKEPAGALTDWKDPTT